MIPQVIPFKSPLKKGDFVVSSVERFRGLCFFWAILQPPMAGWFETRTPQETSILLIGALRFTPPIQLHGLLAGSIVRLSAHDEVCTIEPAWINRQTGLNVNAGRLYQILDHGVCDVRHNFEKSFMIIKYAT